MRRFVADDDPAAVIFNRAGENLARARAQTRRHNDERLLPDDRRVRIGQRARTVAKFRRLRLNDRARLNKEPGEFDRFRKGTAPVVTDIDDARVDVLTVEVFENRANVGAGASAARKELRLHIKIEARQIDNADLQAGNGVGRALFGRFFVFRIDDGH